MLYSNFELSCKITHNSVKEIHILTFEFSFEIEKVHLSNHTALIYVSYLFYLWHPALIYVSYPFYLWHSVFFSIFILLGHTVCSTARTLHRTW